MRHVKNLIAASAAVGLLSIAGTAGAAAIGYTIVDIGTVNGHASSQGFRVSANGLYATGRSLGTPGSLAYRWNVGPVAGGATALPNLASPARNFGVGNAVNDLGFVVGTGSTTAFGSNPLPLVWDASGNVSQLPLPAGQTFGRANDINNSGTAVGSVNGGSLERAVYYSGGTGTVITATGPGGTFMTTSFGVSNSNLAVGNGIDPNNAARNVGLVYDITSNTMVEVGALAGANGALAFDISNAGHVVGSSMQNQGSGLPFIWTSGGGMNPIPLPVGTSQGSARGVNSSGWAVGTASSAFAIPFLFDGTNTYRLQDILVGGAGWDLSTNTSSSALGISDDGIIVGTGVFNGAVHAYAMIPVPAPSAGAGMVMMGLLAAARRRR